MTRKTIDFIRDVIIGIGIGTVVLALAEILLQNI